MTGFAALLFTGRMNAGHPIAAMGMEFDAIAAVIVGGTERQRGNGWLPGTVLGVLAVGVLKNGLNVMAVPSSPAGREYRTAADCRAAYRLVSEEKAVRHRLIGVGCLPLLSACPGCVRFGLESAERASAGEPDFLDRVRADTRDRWRRSRSFRWCQPGFERVLCRRSHQVDWFVVLGIAAGLACGTPSGC